MSGLSQDEVTKDLFDATKRLKRENEELQSSMTLLRVKNEMKDVAIQKLHEDISFYREVLGFYADLKNYQNSQTEVCHSDIHYDKGSRARLILEELYDPSQEMTRQNDEVETDKK